MAPTERTEHTIDVLVGVDGSDLAAGALAHAVRLFGPFAGRFTIATVCDYDGGLDNVPLGERERARGVLHDTAQACAGTLGREPDVVLLVGRPAQALARHAHDEGYDLVVIAPRGKGASRLVFGSVASYLARGVGIPVAILPPIAADAADAPGDAAAAS